MGLDYWIVHFTWTLPPGLLLTAAYWPFFTRLEVNKILTLIFVAVVATIPWDSYLVRNRIWSYPADAVTGYTFFAIPLEEVFFFIIQTYNTALLFVILTKRLVLPAYLSRLPGKQALIPGSVLLLSGWIYGATCVYTGGRYTYTGLILVWACPVLLLQWLICGRFLLAFPKKEIFLSIGLPSLYLCTVDNLALERGTWVIEHSTKLNLQLWGSLEFEEALFFFITNVLIVFGLTAINHAIAIVESRIACSPGTTGESPSYFSVLVSYFNDRAEYHDVMFLEGLAKAVDTVRSKSQSMYMGSAMFDGLLRINLILLYSFCRVMDDLVDDALDRQSADNAIQTCRQALEDRFAEPGGRKRHGKSGVVSKSKELGQLDSVKAQSLSSSVALLPISRMTIEPLLDLLPGFKTDLEFGEHGKPFPIDSEKALEKYADHVAGAVAASLLQLVFSHYRASPSGRHNRKDEIIKTGRKMGLALQYVNIARDVEEDAIIGRVYMPTSWLAEEGLKPCDVIEYPYHERVWTLRQRLLDKADGLYESTVDTINELPREVRGPVRTVVKSYMMNRRRIREGPGRRLKASGKRKLPLWRRLIVAWLAMWKD